jgi:hypothetical protein
VAASEPPDSTASNKDDPVDEARAEALSAYIGWLEGAQAAAERADRVEERAREERATLERQLSDGRAARQVAELERRGRAQRAGARAGGRSPTEPQRPLSSRRG